MNVIVNDEPTTRVQHACATNDEVLGRNSDSNESNHPVRSDRTEINDYDLVRELLQRRATFRRCDQYINNPEFDCGLQELWRQIKSREEANIKRLQKLLAKRSGGLLSLLPDLTEPEHFLSLSSPR